VIGDLIVKDRAGFVKDRLTATISLGQILEHTEQTQHQHQDESQQQHGDDENVHGAAPVASIVVAILLLPWVFVV
jgi:hypothetical protein